MSRSLETLKLYCSTVLSASSSHAPWLHDHKSLPIPWRSIPSPIQPPSRPLRIGFLGPHDNLIHVHPPVLRALTLTEAALRSASHETLQFAPTLHPIITKNLLASFYDLGGGAITSLLRPYNEPIFPTMQGYATAFDAGTELNVTQMRQKVIQRNSLQQAYLDQWLATADSDKNLPPMDALIMATSPWAVPRLSGTQKTFYIGYTGVVNFLDFAACTFPVTHVDKELDKAVDMSGFEPLSELDTEVQGDYDAEFYHGAPVGLQVVGRRLEEEKVLEVVEVVVRCLREAGVK